MTHLQRARQDIHDGIAHEARTVIAVASRIGAMERGELPSLKAAALERAGELAMECRFQESRRVLELNYFVED